MILILASVGLVSAKMPLQSMWKEDVSHFPIPNRAVSGEMGGHAYAVTSVLLHKNISLKMKGKTESVETYRLEFLSAQGTPGAELTFVVKPGTKLDGFSFWEKSIMECAPKVMVGSGDRTVTYPPIQGVWLHGKRNAKFTAMAVFEMLGVDKFSIRVTFDRASGGKLPGHIYFCGQPSKFWKSPQSVLVGDFQAKILPIGK